MSAYVVHKSIHIHYLNKEKFAQIEILAQNSKKLFKMTKKNAQNAHSGPRWDPIRIFYGRETTFIVLFTENGYGRTVCTLDFMKSTFFWTL